MRTIDPKVIINIRGKKYTQDVNCPIADLRAGDVVLDKKDLTHGVIDMIFGDTCAVRDGWATEIGVPLTRLIKLNEQGI